MTDSTSTGISEATSKPTSKRSLLLRGGLWFLVVLLFLILSATSIVVWLGNSNSGAQYGCALLSKLTGVQFQGVSGSLANQLRIQHIEFRKKESAIFVDNLELQWQPKLLLQHRLQLDYLRVDNLEIVLPAGDDQPATLPDSLQLPVPLKLIHVDQLDISHIQLVTVDAQHLHNQPREFTGIKAEVSIDAVAYYVRLSGVTPWGNASLKGALGASTPFQIEAKFDWQGLAIKKNDITLPESTLHGAVSGNLSRINLEAQLFENGVNVDQSKIMNSANTKINEQVAEKIDEKISGNINAVLTPFSLLPIDRLKLNLTAINPQQFYKDAPKANIEINADFKIDGDMTSPVLSGHLFAKNLTPGTLNSGGIPVAQINSDLTMSEKKMNWTSTKIEFGQSGLAAGDGELLFESKAGGKKSDKILPDIAAQFDLTDINLLRIDSRLKRTKLSGKIKTKNYNNELNFLLNLQNSSGQTDKVPSARLIAQMSLNSAMVLSASQLELTVNDTTLNAHGSVGLYEARHFLVEGEAHNFNPANWVDVPVGRVSSNFKLTGQLNQGWRVDAKLSSLEGQFAGLNLQGESDFNARQDHLLSIKKLELIWGKNHFSANGDWQLGEHLVANQHEHLQISLAVPDLAALSEPFKKLFQFPLQGSFFADGVISGNVARPSGHLDIKAEQITIPDLVYLDKLQAALALDDGDQGKIEGQLTLTGLSTSPRYNVNADKQKFRVERLEANLSGLRHDHALVLTAIFPEKEQFVLQAQGNLNEMTSNASNTLNWTGVMQSADLSGPLTLKLMAPFQLQLTNDSAQMGEAVWQGDAGKIHVEKINWSRGNFTTSGRLQEIQVVKALNLWSTDLPVVGNLTMDASWQLQFDQKAVESDAGHSVEPGAPNMAGQFSIRRTGGDLAMNDLSNGHISPIGLGLHIFSVQGSFGNLEKEKIANPGAGQQGNQHSTHQVAQQTNQQATQQQFELQVEAQGDQLGLLDARAISYLTRTEQGWEFSQHAPLTGQATVQMKDIRWMSRLLGSGVSLQGAVEAKANLSGTRDEPVYNATVNGENLQVAFSELGILLPNGSLSASIDQNKLNLTMLKFTQTIKKPPSHEHLDDLSWINEMGVFMSTGSIDLKTGRGSISTNWQKFPFIQNPESWMVATGDAKLIESEKSWNLSGQLITDAAFFSVPKQASPKLSSDVVVLKKNEKRVKDKSGSLQTNLDFNIKTGNNFIFVGRGIDTRLSGDIRLRSKNGSPILASGSIQTMGGTYEGYGQKLAIDRGILNFQGPMDNPGLNVRAIRRGLAVEAGVEVAGTVSKPTVHLISEPDVPDPDKLSWMILGRGADQSGGSDTTLLLSAAGAIFGGDDSGSIPSTITHSLGLGDMSFGTTTTAPQSQLPAQTVAGTINNATPSDQVFSVGKRIAPNLVFSIERSLTDASNGLKLTWQLTRRFSIIGRAGTDTAIDGQYLFSFD